MKKNANNQSDLENGSKNDNADGEVLAVRPGEKQVDQEESFPCLECGKIFRR